MQVSRHIYCQIHPKAHKLSSTGMDTRDGEGNGNSLKFKGGFGCWGVPKYLKRDISETVKKLPRIITHKDRLGLSEKETLPLVGERCPR